MAKLTILIPLFVALLFVVHACASRSEESCEKQLERVKLRHCEKHIRQQIQQKQEEEEEEQEEEEDVLKLRGINYIRWRGSTQKQQPQQELMQCCDQLSELNNPKCQCRALQQIMENQSEELQGKHQAQLMQQELKKLPTMCGLGPLRGCDLSCEED